MGLSVDFFAAYFVAMEVSVVAISSAIGLAIFWRKSDDRMALFVSLMLLTLGAALVIPYPLLDLPLIWTLSAEVVSFVGAASLVLFFYLFPDGRFVPRWTRWLALVWIVGAMIPNTFFPERFLPVFGHPLAYAFLGAGFAGTTLFAQVYRYRRVSSPTQRQQTKWVVFGLVMALGGGVCIGLAQGRDNEPLSGSRLAASWYERSRVGSGLLASNPCPAGVRREPRCVPLSDLKT